MTKKGIDESTNRKKVKIVIRVVYGVGCGTGSEGPVTWLSISAMPDQGSVNGSATENDKNTIRERRRGAKNARVGVTV